MIPIIYRVLTLVAFLTYPLYASGEITSYKDNIVVKRDIAVKKDKGEVLKEVIRISNRGGWYKDRKTANQFGELKILNINDVVGNDHEIRLEPGDYIIEVLNHKTKIFDQKAILIWDGHTVNVKSHGLPQSEINETPMMISDKMLSERLVNAWEKSFYKSMSQLEDKLFLRIVEENAHGSEDNLQSRNSEGGIRTACKDVDLDFHKREITNYGSELSKAIVAYHQRLFSGASSRDLERAQEDVVFYAKVLSGSVRDYNEAVEKTCGDIKPDYKSITEFSEKVAGTSISESVDKKTDSYTLRISGKSIIVKVNGKTPTPDPENPIEVMLYRTDSFGDDRDKKFTLNTYGEIELLAPGRPDKSESQKVLEPGPYNIVIDGNYQNQKRLDWDGKTISISSVDNKSSSETSEMSSAVKTQNKETSMIVEGGTKEPLSADDSRWVFEVAAGVGRLGYDGTQKGVEKAASDAGGAVISADDSSTEYNIEIGASKKGLMLNVFYRDGADFSGSFSPNASTTVEGTESIKSYGATIGYRQSIANTKWYGTIKGGYMWIEDDFSSTLRNQSGVVSQFSTSADDDSIIVGAGVGYKFNRRNAFELNFNTTLGGVFEEDTRLDSLTVEYRHFVDY